MDRIFSSMSWRMLVWFFFSICGSNSPFRSRGTEGCNNAIKTLKRVAFGFRNFRSFRARILLSLGPYPNI